MSFWPAGFAPRDDRVGILDLCEVDTSDGPARFLLGTDGRFTDVNGNTWYGSQLLSVDSVEMPINDVAPRGTLQLTYFQDPAAPSLISEMKAEGVDYVRGRPIRFLVQPLRSLDDLYAPHFAPIQWASQKMTTLTFSKQGELQRSIGVEFVGWNEDRRAARRITLNTEGHAILIGEANPSLEFMPTDDFQDEKLFG